MSTCHDCQQEITGEQHPTYYGGQVCDGCYQSGFTCNNCGIAISSDDLDADGWCDRCHNKQYDDCSNCHEGVQKGGLKDGRCDACQES